MPSYNCYIADIEKLDIKFVSEYTGRELKFARYEDGAIIINTDCDELEGLHDINIVVEMPSARKAVRNEEARFRVEIVSRAECVNET